MVMRHTGWGHSRYVIGVLLALTLIWPVQGRTRSDMAAPTDPAQTCLSAAAQAAQAEGVPLDMLVTLALVESGRDMGRGLAPWAWAVHAQGRGHWAEQRADALALAQAALNTGTTNIDLGCFQINYRWHGAQFATLDAMLDPLENAHYAARLLRSHRDRLGSWDAAIGAYHSGTPELADAYRARFARLASHTPAMLSVAQAKPFVPTRQTPPPTAGAIALHLAASAGPILNLTGAQR